MRIAYRLINHSVIKDIAQFVQPHMNVVYLKISHFVNSFDIIKYRYIWIWMR